MKSHVKDFVAGLLTRFGEFTSSALAKQMGTPCSSGGNIDSELQQDLHSFVSPGYGRVWASWS
jgi:hypothetical protein